MPVSAGCVPSSDTTRTTCSVPPSIMCGARAPLHLRAHRFDADLEGDASGTSAEDRDDRVGVGCEDRSLVGPPARPRIIPPSPSCGCAIADLSARAMAPTEGKCWRASSTQKCEVQTVTPSCYSEACAHNGHRQVRAHIGPWESTYTHTTSGWAVVRSLKRKQGQRKHRNGTERHCGGEQRADGSPPHGGSREDH